MPPTKGVDPYWPWFVKAFYPNGEEAIATRHKTEASRDMEIQAARTRPDIGRIETGYRYLVDLNPKRER